MKTQRLCVWKATLKKSLVIVNYSKSDGMSSNWEQKSLEITETHSKSSLLSWIDIEQYFQLLDNIEIKNSMRTITLIYLLWVLCKIGRFSNTWMLKESRLCHSIDEPQFGRREWISGTFVWDTTTAMQYHAIPMQYHSLVDNNHAYSYSCYIITSMRKNCLYFEKFSWGRFPFPW